MRTRKIIVRHQHQSVDPKQELKMLSAARFTRPLARQLARQKASFSSAKSSTLIINAVGQDRLGIVSDVTGLVTDMGGNVGESQAARLGAHFSLMMLVQVPSDQVDSLQEQIRLMPDMNAAVFEAQQPTEKKMAAKVAYQGVFTLQGADNPGIVYRVTSALAKHGLSIEQMETDQEIAPHGGTCLFKMRGRATAAAPLANGFDAMKIRHELVALGETLNCDVTLDEVHDESYENSFYAG